MTEKERKAELEHFSEIEAVIDENLEKLCQMRDELKEQLLGVRRGMWDDGRHLIRDFDDVIELTARDSEVSSAENRFEQNEAEIRRQNRQKLSPYFGRLDYEDNGLSRTVYIGIYGLRRNGSHRMLSDEFKQSHSQIPWAKISGLLHRLVHDYDNTSWTLICTILFDELPGFLTALQEL